MNARNNDTKNVLILVIMTIFVNIILKFIFISVIIIINIIIIINNINNIIIEFWRKIIIINITSLILFKCFIYVKLLKIIALFLL